MIKYKIFLIFSALVLFILSGCATVIKDFDAYQNAGAPRSPNAPSGDKIQTSQTKVVIYGIENLKGGKKSNISRLLSSNIQRLLTQTNVKIIDRSVLETFSEEAILAQTKSGNEGSAAAAAADYAIKGDISGNTSSSFKEGYYTYEPAYSKKDENGNEIIDANGNKIIVPAKAVYNPPTCRYNANISGQFEIYSLPELKQTLVVPLRGSSSATREQNAPCRDTVTSSRLLGAAVNSSLTTAQRRRVLNEFAAKGYVRELRKHQKKKGKYIVNITLGRNHGIRQESKIDIYKPQFVIDPLSQKEKIKNKKIAEAVISNLVEGNSAWGVIKDEEQAKNISIGDIVKVRY